MYCSKKCKVMAFFDRSGRNAARAASKIRRTTKLAERVMTRQHSLALAEQRARLAETERNIRMSRLCIGCGKATDVAGRFRCLRCSAANLRSLRKDNKRLRRAIVRGATAAVRISNTALFSAYQWRCVMCGCVTPSQLVGTNDPREPTCDHIMPLSSGGEHVWSNVQLLCRHCNCSKKRAKVYMGAEGYKFLDNQTETDRKSVV